MVTTVVGDLVPVAAAAIVEACRMPLCTASVHLAAERLISIRSPEQVDDLLTAIRDAQPINRERLAELARWICRFGGGTAGQLRSSVAILGIAGNPSDADLIKQLGAERSLAPFAIVALRNLLADPTSDVVEVVRLVMKVRRETQVPLTLLEHLDDRARTSLAQS